MGVEGIRGDSIANLLVGVGHGADHFYWLNLSCILYTVITPDTPLEELATFFEEESNKASFALITDSGE